MPLPSWGAWLVQLVGHAILDLGARAQAPCWTWRSLKKIKSEKKKKKSYHLPEMPPGSLPPIYLNSLMH